MNYLRLSKSCALTAFVAFASCSGSLPAIAAPAAGDGVQVLTRGPVHEAFAEVITFDHQPGVVAPKAPPDAIDEVPPDQKPAGANVAWIPGYWAWDDEQSDFMWVSGLWRFLPLGRQWVAGYWGKSDKGYQWTSGYWGDAKTPETEYLSKPPELVNVDPVGDAPSENESWIPGVQVWDKKGYATRPGYWAKMQTDWVWTPAHYVWSPRGYVFVDGYWDYSVNRRGMLFAPVSFNSSVYTQPGFTYSPINVISTTALLGNLFLRPSYGHYYFGDYYASNYAGMGFYAPYAFQNNQGYDPFFAQQTWQNRHDSRWEQNEKAQFENRRDNEEARPPRTLAAQDKLVKSGKSKDENSVVATPLQELAKSKDSPMKLESVSKSEREAFAKSGKEIQVHRTQRAKLESSGSGAGANESADRSSSAKVKLPPSPIVAKSTNELSADHTPPKVHDTPKADPRGTSAVTAKKPVIKDDPAAAPKVPKTEPKPAPTAEPKSEPKAEPKPMPNETPKAVPKAGPKIETPPVPKAEPKPTPKSF